MCAPKEAVSVAEMARIVGLSRARFYQLMGSAFPHPIYDVATKRPYYSLILQEQCLEVRLRNCGIDGKPVLFHQRAHEVSPPKRSRRTVRPDDRHQDLVDGLRSLGLPGVSSVQVEAALKELGGAVSAKKDNGEVLRAVFLRLKHQDTSCGRVEGP